MESEKEYYFQAKSVTPQQLGELEEFARGLGIEWKSQRNSNTHSLTCKNNGKIQFEVFNKPLGKTVWYVEASLWERVMGLFFGDVYTRFEEDKK